MIAFRCKNCGRLEAGEHAGENAVPHACRVCGHGVEYNRYGHRLLTPKNWEVLHEATDERLAELGLTRNDVEQYAPAVKTAGVGRVIEVEARDGAGTTDGV